MDAMTYCQRVAANFVMLAELAPTIEIAAKKIKACFDRGNRLLLCGNGGSAADAQHIAAEFVGRYKKIRQPLPAIALTTDTSILTAVANDFGYATVFERQLLAVARPDDVLLAISTSGNSENIIRAAWAARDLGAIIIGLTGSAGGELRNLCDPCICVPSADTNHVQEMHIAIGHFIAGFVEA